MMQHWSPATSACLILLAPAVFTDLHRRAIPNAITISGVGGGLVYHLMSASGPGFAFFGLLVGGLLLMAPYLQGWTGAGDVKLLAALGSWLGPITTLWVFLYATAVGGIMAGFLAMRRYRFMAPGTKSKTRLAEPHPGIPFAVALSAGYLIFRIWGLP
jgi:Flp pilus assembly protein protease CpaA